MVGFHLAESVRHPAGPDRSVEFPPRRRHLHRPAWRPAYFRFHRGATFLSAALMRTGAGPWGSLVYPWRFGTFRPRFKSGRTHLFTGWNLIESSVTGTLDEESDVIAAAWSKKAFLTSINVGDAIRKGDPGRGLRVASVL